MTAVTLSGTTVTVATGAGAATLMLASPVFPSLVARSTAVPALSARTVAEAPAVLAIDSTDGSVLDHDTARLRSTFPAASRTSAAKVALSPTVRLALPGTTITVATPSIRPVTRAESPKPVTLAVSAGLLVHVTDGFCTGFPLASPTAANRVIVPPTPTEVGPEMRRYAPPLEPALGSRTDKGVVLPAVTCTPGVITGSRFGRNGSSIRTT